MTEEVMLKSEVDELVNKARKVQREETLKKVYTKLASLTRETSGLKSFGEAVVTLMHSLRRGELKGQ